MLNTIEHSTTKLVRFIESNQPLLVLTGAGCSTESGIPDYRDRDGNWKYTRPMLYNDFVNHEHLRKRYWARSIHGWMKVARARPNAAHLSLAQLEQAGLVKRIITQNVDGLHQRAGSQSVIELHGQLKTVKCLKCQNTALRSDIQSWLETQNETFDYSISDHGPDGDAVLHKTDFSKFRVPTCTECGGILKPDVVFFGEQVPRSRVDQAMLCLKQSNAMLIIGSSLSVFSGYRFCRAAKEQNMAMAAINLGRTRADPELTLKITKPCGQVLTDVAEQLISSSHHVPDF